MKTRVRFGLKLSWPIRNAAIFVFYMDSAQFGTLLGYVEQLRPFLPADINARLVCEAS